MKNTFRNIIRLFSILLMFTSCNKEDEFGPEDTFLGSPIPIFEVNEDYNVGAFYKFPNWNLNYNEMPVSGTYTAANTDQFPTHIRQANKAGINFFLFDLVSSQNAGGHSSSFDIVARYNNELAGFTPDSIVKYAFNYNYGPLGINNNNPVDSTTDETTNTLDPKEIVFQQDFLNIADLAENNTNYYRLDGKPVVYILNAQNLAANDSPAVFNRMRQAVRDAYNGMELYIIGMQPQWQPPLRYDFRFVGAVDAVTHNTYMQLNENNSYERILYFDKMVYGAWSYSQEALGRSEFNLEYIPTISPSSNYKLQNPNNQNYIFEKNEKLFRSVCNAARGAVGESKMVLLESFNNWNIGTQIEESNELKVDGVTPAYGDQYLKILKEEFKVAK
ncbi:glycoside hydrolase family 99-like domain-containing protein [Ochrovirga pacifica]|uniref:glycoside hydrolase family 99-like domain-containing protein n=1 Tax=Ochrovirga pacifica TaxID=1042376 RepID=UPI000255A551|nr:hypothetical protein [Ochrovirga pacifica]